MEELLKKYNVRIREFEIDLGKSKVICRDVIPKEELLEKMKKIVGTLYLYPNYFIFNNFVAYSSQDFLIENFEKIFSFVNSLGRRKVIFYGNDLDLLSFIVNHTSVRELRVVEKNKWVVVNNLVYNLSCGEAGLINLLMYLQDLFRPLILGNCDLLKYVGYFVNRGVVSFLKERVFIDGNVISPPNLEILSYISTKFLKNRYEINNPTIDVISIIKKIEESFSSKKVVIKGSNVYF
ncbi:hypothetical protein EWF20_07960 [Sulfolobus sp. S-194]|uniref:hypothetical protein n=1 Tax=Sulfolobus sp. S-194 TaxID=2512240 RepID=UPI001437330E|nr:hypothetical protein [Sulfolobus sp. S-194]QIW24084.1 hypothetical protein EWF20_07960 [Sulfolobus sp. S-194]